MVFRIFLRGNRTRSILMLLSLLVAATVEAIGIGALLPAAAAVMGEGGKAGQTSQIVDHIVSFLGVQPTLLNLIMLIAGAVVLKAVISFAALSYAAVAAADIAVGFRQRLITAVFGASWRYYADEHSGKFANAVSNESTRAAQAYMLVAQVVALFAQAVLLGVVAILYNWKMAMASIVVGLILSVTMNRLVGISRNAGRRESDANALITMNLVDMLANMKALKSMDRSEPMLVPLGRLLRKLRRALITGEMARLGFNFGNEIVVTLLITIGIYLAYSYWQVTLTDLLVFALVFFKINDVISRVQKQLQQSVKYERSYQRIMEQIVEAEAQRENNPGSREPVLTRSCRFEDVSFSHGEKEIVRGIDLEIPKGSITVLKGPSGAGKTTLIDLLIGLYQPRAGRITVDGVPLQEIDLHRWRRKIGYVPQELSLLHANVRDNITFSDQNITDAMVADALQQARAADFVANLPEGLDTSVGEMGGKMSGGQRQRISLARALVTGPELLILDEVTSALDPVTEQEIVQNIASFRGRYTIIAITHRPAWTAIADRLYEVNGGSARLVEDGDQLATA